MWVKMSVIVYVFREGGVDGGLNVRRCKTDCGCVMVWLCGVMMVVVVVCSVWIIVRMVLNFVVCGLERGGL